MELMIQWDKRKGNDTTWPVIDRQTGEKVGEIRRTSEGYSVLSPGASEWSSPQAFPVTALALL